MGVADGEDGGCACSGGANGGGGSESATNGKTLSRQQRVARNGAPGFTRGPSSAAEAVAVSTAAKALAEWLAGLGLGAYESRLVSQGFDTLETMGTATESDLEAMGFKKGHLRLLLARAPSAMHSGGFQAAIPGTDPAALVAAGSPSTRGKDANTTGLGTDGKLAVAARNREEKGDEGGPDDGVDGRYCDARALQPTRAFSVGDSNSGDGGGNGDADGFKELRPEEVEIDNVIGEGSFGVVRRGRWRGMDVAVKELKTCIASAAAAAAASAAVEAGAVGATAGETAGAVAGAVVGGLRNSRARSDSIDGEEEMRHEARMLAKVCNHVW